MPTTPAIEKPKEVYEMKVTLLGTDPPIWRRLLVPAELTLEQLHHVLQRAMGWEDCHMHEFRVGQQRFGKPDPMEQAFGGPRTASERTARSFSVLAVAVASAAALFLGPSILVPVTEVGSMAPAFGWFAACTTYSRIERRPGRRGVAVAGGLVAAALMLIKLLPFVPCHFHA